MPIFKKRFPRKTDDVTRGARVLDLNPRLRDEMDFLVNSKQSWDKTGWEVSKKQLLSTINLLAKQRSRKAKQLLKERKKINAGRKK